MEHITNDNAKLSKNAAKMEQHLTSPTVTLMLFASIVGAVIYMIFLLQPSYRGDLIPYTMVILAEVFLISHAIMSFWTILSGRHEPKNFKYHTAFASLFGHNNQPITESVQAEDQPIQSQLYINGKKATVDVFIPVYGESIEEIRQTATAAKKITGTHKTYILDDGKSELVSLMAKEIGIKYISRPDNNFAKAGNINHALSLTSADFFVILDADFIASKDFLKETLPFFHDTKLAFVQTPQFYYNDVNFISTAASYMQHVFYSLVQVGKNRFNSAFCVGTNVIFRRSAIEDIGTIYYKSKSEDIWTSLVLHEHGYRSMYLNKVLAAGRTPETIKAYVKQQRRWATGSFEIFLKRNPLRNKKLTIDQRLQYFATTSFYFNGFAVAALLLLPVLQIFFNITPIAVEIPFWQWSLLYSGFYVTQIFLSMYIMGGFKFQTLMLSVVTFPVYIHAFFDALLNRDQKWNATNSAAYGDSPFNYIRTQLYIFVFLLITTAAGIWKVIYTDEFSVSIVWCLLNTSIFGYFIAIAINEGSTKGTKKRNNIRSDSRKLSRS